MPSTDPGVHSFGRELRASQLNAIRVSETEVPRSLELSKHRHEPGQICVILEGGFRDQTPGGDHWMRPGMVRCRPPGLPHANQFDMDENTLVLLVSIDAPRWVPFADGGPVLAPGAWRRVVAEMQRELRRCDDASLLALEGLALLLASKVTRGTALERDARQPAWLSDALECIDRSFADAITVASIAERVGVHRATLAAAFRRYRGVSAGELIRERRVHHAMVLLAGTRIPLDELAQQAGFCDQSHMSRLFRRAIGMTPGKYRAVSS